MAAEDNVCVVSHVEIALGKRDEVTSSTPSPVASHRKSSRTSYSVQVLFLGAGYLLQYACTDQGNI